MENTGQSNTPSTGTSYVVLGTPGTPDTSGMRTSMGTSTFNNWSFPERIDIQEFDNKIEFIYKQNSMMQLAVYPPRPPETRVFKIVFSCIDGKWNKSESIYGVIKPSQGETYIF